MPDASTASATGDEAAFAALVDRHRRELHVHCYRMLGSFEEAEDLVQETFLRAWRRRHSFQGGPGLRAWLYRIATNACLDELRRNRRRLSALHSLAEVPWLQPYPDRLLDEIAPSDSQPDAVVVARETIELTFLAVIQLLPPSSGRCCCCATCSAGRRARPRRRWTPAWLRSTARSSGRGRRSGSGCRHARRSGPAPSPASRSARCWRPSSTPTSAPTPPPRRRWRGRTSASPCRRTRGATTAWRRSRRCWSGGSPSRATGGCCPPAPTASPAAANYLRARGDSEFRAFKLDVLRVQDGAIAEITTFDARGFPEFGFPPTL